MVLKLREICLNSIARSFYTISNFDSTLLHAGDREKVIERLANHNLFNLQNKFNEDVSSAEDELQYRQSLVRNFFYGHLDSVRFDSCSQLDDSFLQLIVKLTPEKLFIRSFAINNCEKLTDNGICEFMREKSTSLEELSITNTHVTLDQSLNTCIRSSHLTLIDLSFCSLIVDRNLWSLCKNNPMIKCLKLAYCKQVTNVGVRAALHMLNRLESLDLEGIGSTGTGFFADMTEITSTSKLNVLCILKSLSFCGTSELDNPEIKSMAKLFKNCPKLRELSILYSTASHTDMNHSNLTLEQSPLIHLPVDLQSLSLYRPDIKKSQIIVGVLKRLKNLKELSLNGVECLDDQALSQIFENNGHSLTAIRLAGYMALTQRNLSESCLNSLAKHCRSLKRLNFEQFSLSNTFRPLSKIFEDRKTTEKVEDVNFSVCRQIDPGLLTTLSINCKNLRRLDLSGLNQLVTNDLIKTIASSATKLAFLDIKSCTKVTDDSICLLATKCPSINYLVLSGINSLTDKVIFCIANHLQFQLKEIYLCGCSKISRTSLRYLTDCCVNRLICYHNCPNYNPNEIYAKNLDTGDFERF